MPACPGHPGLLSLYNHGARFTLQSVLDWLLWSSDSWKTMAFLEGPERTKSCSICLVMGNWGVMLKRFYHLTPGSLFIHIKDLPTF